MNLTKIKPFVITASVILPAILILITFWLLNRTKPITQQPITSPQPATKSTRLKQAPEFESELAKIRNSLPYKSQDYSVEYIQALNMLNVKISAQSAEEFINTKKQAEDFIKSEGVTNICALNIFWIPQANQQVRQPLDPKALITSGCSL